MEMDEIEHSNEEIRILLKKNLVISEDSNRMIRSMRNSARFHSFVRILILMVIVAGVVWGYRFFKPYMDQARDTYNSYNAAQVKFTDTVNKFIPGKTAQ